MNPDELGGELVERAARARRLDGWSPVLDLHGIDKPRTVAVGSVK